MSRAAVLTLFLSLVLSGHFAHAQSQPVSSVAAPIIFVHGNGDDASRWIPTMWLFESNGYPADRLFAIRFHNPVARTDDTRNEEFRSSTEQAKAELSQYVQEVLHRTRAAKVILVGSSRGGLTIRNYVQNGGGARFVEADVLCGTPNHGVTASEANQNNEFNGKGTFLSALNHAGVKGDEVVSGVRTLTLRSDALDKYAQPYGVALGRPDQPTGVTAEGPSLLGAQNVVLPTKDHREVAFSNEAFAAMYRFITGSAPKTLTIVKERQATVSGLITGFAGQAPTNDPLAGVHLQVTEMTPAGLGRVIYQTTTSADGAWGPIHPKADALYAFDLESAGRHVTFFLPSLPRSTKLLNLRFMPTPAEAAGKAGFMILRPDGYFSRDRDPVRVDGKAASQEPAGLPLRDGFLEEVTPRTLPVAVELREERILVVPSANLSTTFSVAEFLR